MASKEQVEILLKLQDEFSKELKRALGTSEKSVKKFSKANVLLTGAMLSLGHQLTNVAKNMVRGLKDTILLSARYETMGIVVDNLGGRIGKTAGEMRGFERDLQTTGISLVGSREAVSRLIAAQIDLEHSTKLARIAQDGAVIANTNSTESFERLIAGITTGQVRILRTMNLFVDFKGAMKDYAKANDKTVQSLTELDRIQARTNAVLDAGSQIAGTYEAAMESAGKQLGSLERDTENLKVAIGNLAQGMLKAAVPATRKLAQAVTDALTIRQEWNFAMERGLVTEEELINLQFDAKDAADLKARSTELLTERLERYEESQSRVNAMIDEFARGLGNVDGRESVEAMGELEAAAREAWEELQNIPEEVKTRVITTFDSQSAIQGLAEQYERKLLGGELLADIEQRIQIAIAMNAPDAEIMTLLAEGTAAELAVDVSVGDLTPLEAAKTLSDEFKINQGRARELIDSWVNKLKTEGPPALQGMVNKSILLGEMAERPAGLMTSIIDNFNALHDKEITITVNYETTGDDIRRQHGGAFRGAALVGDPGPNAELVFGSGIVIPAGKTKEILKSGILPVKGFQGGGGFAFDADTLRQITDSRPTKAPGTGGIFRGNVSSGIRDALASSGGVAPAATRQAIAQVVQESVETGQEAAKETIVAAVKIAAEQQTANLQPQFDRQIAAQDNTNDLLERIELVLIQQPDSEEARDIAFESKDTSGF